MRVRVDKTGQQAAAGEIEDRVPRLLLDGIGRHLLDLAVVEHHRRFLHHLQTPGRSSHDNRVLQDRWAPRNPPVAVFLYRIEAQSRRRPPVGFFSRAPALFADSSLDDDRDDPASDIHRRAIEQNQVRVFSLLDGANFLFQSQPLRGPQGNRLQRLAGIETASHRGASLQTKIPRTHSGGRPGGDHQGYSSVFENTRKALALRPATQVPGTLENRPESGREAGSRQLPSHAPGAPGAQKGEVQLELFVQTQSVTNIVGTMGLDEDGKLTLQYPAERLEDNVELGPLWSLGRGLGSGGF